MELVEKAANLNGTPIHPIRLVHELQTLLSDDMTLCLDMGSFHIWLARYLYSFRARQILMTNGQQTLGVSLPWAIAASLARPSEKVISVSGDGGFLFFGKIGHRSRVRAAPSGTIFFFLGQIVARTLSRLEGPSSEAQGGK